MTSDEYHRESHQGHVKCAHCQGDIHFGPAAMVLRDADDSALDDNIARSVAWYHTSTEVDWPAGSYPMPPLQVERLAAMMPPDAAHQARTRYESKALHLGAYEAAIESMLRRMRNQDDGGERFHLFRATLSDGLTIEPGWRDENSDEAAQITQADMGDSDVIRYLNVHESPGSISLAVRRSAIASVQRVPLPGHAVRVSATSPLLLEVTRCRTRIAQIEASRPAELDQLEQLQERAARKQGIPFVRRPPPLPEQTVLLDRIGQITADEFLPGVSRPVRERFASALDAWRLAQDAPVDDESYICHFASMAAVLTNSDEILRMLDDVAPQKI